MIRDYHIIFKFLYLTCCMHLLPGPATDILSLAFQFNKPTMHHYPAKGHPSATRLPLIQGLTRMQTYYSIWRSRSHGSTSHPQRCKQRSEASKSHQATHTPHVQKYRRKYYVIVYQHKKPTRNIGLNRGGQSSPCILLNTFSLSWILVRSIRFKETNEIS